MGGSGSGYVQLCVFCLHTSMHKCKSRFQMTVSLHLFPIVCSTPLYHDCNTFYSAVDSHVDCNVQQTERISKLEEELEAVKGREEEAKSLLSTTMAELEQYKGKVDTVDTEWQSKLAVTEDKLSAVQEELDLLRGRYQGLVEEHVQVVEARQALEQSAKGEASSLSHKLGRCVHQRESTDTANVNHYLDCTKLVLHSQPPLALTPQRQSQNKMTTQDLYRPHAWCIRL